MHLIKQSKLIVLRQLKSYPCIKIINHLVKICYKYNFQQIDNVIISTFPSSIGMFTWWRLKLPSRQSFS